MGVLSDPPPRDEMTMLEPVEDLANVSGPIWSRRNNSANASASTWLRFSLTFSRDFVARVSRSLDR